MATKPDLPSGRPHFGALLRRTRDERGLSRSKLADASRLHENTIYGFEKDPEYLGSSASLASLIIALHRAFPLEPEQIDELSIPLGDERAIWLTEDVLKHPGVTFDNDPVLQHKLGRVLRHYQRDFLLGLFESLIYTAMHKAGVEDPKAPEGELINVIESETDHGTHTEKTIRTYEKLPAPPKPAAPAVHKEASTAPTRRSK